MSEREDWIADTEGNLRPPPDEGLKPPTDEFGRDDPESVERERRRREREARRKGGRKAGSDGSGGGIGFARLLGRRRKAAPEEEAPLEEPATPQPRRRIRPRAEAPAPPEAPQARATRRSPPEPAPVRRSARERAGAGRDAIRDRLRRGAGGGGDGESPPPARPGPTYRRRRILALALVLVGVLVAWFLIALFQPPPFDPGKGEGTVAVTVPEGASADDITNLLTDNDVISNGSLFKLRLKLAGKSDSIQSGRYALAHNMSYGNAIDTLTGAGDKVAVTIPEGQSRDQIAPEVQAVGIDGDYMAASKSFQGFDPAKYGAKNPSSLEGFLFPATYEVDRGSDVNTLIGQQLDAFEQNIAGVDLSYAKSKNLTPYDVLTIASMIDKEVAVDKERPLVAAVIYNRLHKGIPLGIDATTRYETHNYTEPIQASTFRQDTPYNTRTHAGLPPTPIGNPGLASIEAAAKPANVNYLYYVVKPGTCEHNFTASEAEFAKFQAEYQQALQAQGGSPTSC
jgi:peptidoglycan lytic transglycosylase G